MIETKPLAGIVLNRTHWDREWNLPFQRYHVLLVNAVDRLLDTFAKDGAGLTNFLRDGQTVTEYYLALRLERRVALQALILLDRGAR